MIEMLLNGMEIIFDQPDSYDYYLSGKWIFDPTDTTDRIDTTESKPEPEYRLTRMEFDLDRYRDVVHDIFGDAGNCQLHQLVTDFDTLNQSDKDIMLNTPIPKLQYLTIVNDSGLNTDGRSYRAGINIHDTGEDFICYIDKPNITMYDILKGVMKVKSSKVDFWYELFSTCFLDEEKQVLTLDFDNGS